MEEGEKEWTLGRNTKPRHPGATAEAANLLTDDLILEILCRLPARSVHRFKCVSVLWRDLIADPANHKKLPQTLAGFLYTTYNYSGCGLHFASVSGEGANPFEPSLSYLHHNKDEGIIQEVTCNGLLLCRRYKKNKVAALKEDDFCFVVCNPITRRRMELPPLPPKSPANRHSYTTGLAFNPVVSSHFHALHFEQTFQETYITGVNIYSSRTGAWSHRDSGMAQKVALCPKSMFSRSRCVFVGSMLYLMGKLADISNDYVLLGVDMEGEVWKTISVPYGQRFGTIGSSQGCLHYAIASVDDSNIIHVSEIELWCLKDCDCKQLVLKHTANINKLVSMTGRFYKVVEFHPDCDTIFLFSPSCGSDTLDLGRV